MPLCPVERYPLHIYCHGTENLSYLLEIDVETLETGETPIVYCCVQGESLQIDQCFKPFSSHFVTIRFLLSWIYLCIYRVAHKKYTDLVDPRDSNVAWISPKWFSKHTWIANLNIDTSSVDIDTSCELHLICELRVASCELRVELKLRVGNSKVRLDPKLRIAFFLLKEWVRRQIKSFFETAIQLTIILSISFHSQASLYHCNIFYKKPLMRNYNTYLAAYSPCHSNIFP